MLLGLSRADDQILSFSCMLFVCGVVFEATWRHYGVVVCEGISGGVCRQVNKYHHGELASSGIEEEGYRRKVVGFIGFAGIHHHSYHGPRGLLIGLH